LAAISSAYPPDLSIRPERIEASRERKTPVFKGKTRAERDYSERRSGTQEKNSKNRWKNALFFGHVQNAQRSCGNARYRDANQRPTGLWYSSESQLDKESRL
jgi:hypothetical protein